MKVKFLVFNLETKKVSLGRDEVSATSAIKQGSNLRLFEQPNPVRLD